MYGYAPRGKPAIAKYSSVSDRRRLSLLMAVHQDGSHTQFLSAQPINGSSFAAFVNELPFGSGTVLLLDNASIHKTAAVKNAAAGRGYELLYTPPYSPEFNPIEMVFGVAKQQFYKSRYAAGWSLDTAVKESVAVASKSVTIRNCFRHTYGIVLERNAYVAPES
jgi:transposase